MSDPQSPKSTENIDDKVVADFGREWKTFSQERLVGSELSDAAEDYFRIFPFNLVNQKSVGFDMGCGSGRWAKTIAPRVGLLRCIDPSSMALEQARKNLKHHSNCEFACESVSNNSLQEGSQDFGYSLGVLHHVPNTLAGLTSCTAKLKEGAPFLLYLYYRFDNKPLLFRLLWQISDVARRIISRLPFLVKLAISQVIAITVYLPLAKFSLLMEKARFNVENVPLSYYRNKSFYFMRTDALDRFGTKLEQRFTKAEIHRMMSQAGLIDIQFSEKAPFWVAVGIRSKRSEQPATQPPGCK
jgi:ubiquinone/menaquinone biosynthesis C-methylase UbiE